MVFENQRRNAGFTLVEVMIALVVSAILMTAVYKSAKTQQDTYITQDQVVSMQQNLRATTVVMTREIRMAGYDPSGVVGAGIKTATANRLEFTFDDGSGAEERIDYFLYTPADGIQKLGRKLNGTTAPVAEYIANLEFNYTMADGTQTLTPAVLADIRSVQVTVLAQTALADEKFDIVGGTNYTTPSMATWNLPSGFRGRMETIKVKCRNLGL